jgi:integrase
VWKATAETRMKLGMGAIPADAFVFGHIDTGAARSPNALTREWTRAVEKIKGVPAVTWHALRHTHASQLLRSGVDVVTVSKRLGYAKPDITLRVYSHLMPGADAAATAVMEKALAGTLGTR